MIVKLGMGVKTYKYIQICRFTFIWIFKNGLYVQIYCSLFHIPYLLGLECSHAMFSPLYRIQLSLMLLISCHSKPECPRCTSPCVVINSISVTNWPNSPVIMASNMLERTLHSEHNITKVGGDTNWLGISMQHIGNSKLHNSGYCRFRWSNEKSNTLIPTRIWHPLQWYIRTQISLVCVHVQNLVCTCTEILIE